MDAVRKVNEERAKRGEVAVHKSNVYRYVDGNTHLKGRQEKRGRKKVLRGKDIVKLEAARRRLLKKADSEQRVKWADVIEDAGFADLVSQWRWKRPCGRKGSVSGFLARRYICRKKTQRKDSRWARSGSNVPNLTGPSPCMLTSTIRLSLCP